MTRYRHQPVAIVPTSNVKAVNAILEKHGYGPNNVCIPVVNKTALTNAKPTHYAIECPADDGFLAALKLAIEGVSGATLVNATRGDPRLSTQLDKANLKVKAAALAQIER